MASNTICAAQTVAYWLPQEANPRLRFAFTLPARALVVPHAWQRDNTLLQAHSQLRMGIYLTGGLSLSQVAPPSGAPQLLLLHVLLHLQYSSPGLPDLLEMYSATHWNLRCPR